MDGTATASPGSLFQCLTTLYICAETFKPLSLMLNLTTLILALLTSNFAPETAILGGGRSLLMFFSRDLHKSET